MAKGGIIMGHTDAEYIFILVAFFLFIGFMSPFVALEFGGTVATYDVNSIGSASFLGILNAITSVLFWTFGLPVWVNLIFTAIRAMMWFIIYRASPLGHGGG